MRTGDNDREIESVEDLGTKQCRHPLISSVLQNMRSHGSGVRVSLATAIRMLS